MKVDFLFDFFINTNIKISVHNTTPFLKTRINLKAYLVYFFLFYLHTNCGCFARVLIIYICCTG
jgi:hypothetical protein